MYQETHEFHDRTRRYTLPRELDGGYALTFRRLRRLFLSRGVPREEAADLAQEAIARALLHLNRRGGHDGYEGVDPLLNRIATNLLIDRARASGPRLVSIENAEEIDDATQDPSEEVARLHEYRAVRAAIGQLSSRHRHALLLTLDGMSPAEIAEHFGIQRNAADALLHRARRRLADRLRVTTEAALGLVAIVALRIRAAARRGAEFARNAEAFASSPAALQAASLALVAAVSMPAVLPAPASAHDVRASGVTPRVSSEANGGAADTSFLARPAPAPASTAREGAAVDARDQSVRVRKQVDDPLTGNDQTAYAESWHNRGPTGDRGLTGPVVDQVTQAACATGVAICDGEIRP